MNPLSNTVNLSSIISNRQQPKNIESESLDQRSYFPGPIIRASNTKCNADHDIKHAMNCFFSPEFAFMINVNEPLNNFIIDFLIEPMIKAGIDINEYLSQNRKFIDFLQDFYNICVDTYYFPLVEHMIIYQAQQNPQSPIFNIYLFKILIPGIFTDLGGYESNMLPTQKSEIDVIEITECFIFQLDDLLLSHQDDEIIRKEKIRKHVLYFFRVIQVLIDTEYTPNEVISDLIIGFSDYEPQQRNEYVAEQDLCQIFIQALSMCILININEIDLDNHNILNSFGSQKTIELVISNIKSINWHEMEDRFKLYFESSCQKELGFPVSFIDKSHWESIKSSEQKPTPWSRCGKFFTGNFDDIKIIKGLPISVYVEGQYISYQKFTKLYRELFKIIESFSNYPQCSDHVLVDKVFVVDNKPVALICTKEIDKKLYFNCIDYNDQSIRTLNNEIKWNLAFDSEGGILKYRYYSVQHKVYLDGNGCCLQGIYEVVDLKELENKKYLDILKPIETKEFNNKQHTIFSNGVPLTGEYRGKLYKDGKIFTGLVNSRYYENGVPTYGVYKDKYKYKYYDSDGYILNDNLISYTEFTQNYKGHREIPSLKIDNSALCIKEILFIEGEPVAVTEVGVDGQYYIIDFIFDILHNDFNLEGLKWGRLFSSEGMLVKGIYHYNIERDRHTIYLNGEGKPLDGIYKVENYGDLENKKDLGILEPIETKEFNNKQHTRFSNGKPLNGEYGGIRYKNGKLFTGKFRDECYDRDEYYDNGIRFTGVTNNYYYEDGYRTYGVYKDKYYGRNGYLLKDDLISFIKLQQNYQSHIESISLLIKDDVIGYSHAILFIEGEPVAVTVNEQYYEINSNMYKLREISSELKWGRLFSEKGTLIQDIYYYEQKGNCPIFLNGKGKALHGIYNVENYGDLEKKEYLGELEPIETKEFDNEQHTLFINGVPLSGEYRGKLYKDGKLCHGTISYKMCKLDFPELCSEIKLFATLPEFKKLLFDDGVAVALITIDIENVDKYHKIDYINKTIISSFNKQELIGNKAVNQAGYLIKNILYLEDLKVYINNEGDLLDGIYEVENYRELENKKYLEILKPIETKEFNNAQHTRFSKGKPLTGKYGGKLYENGKLVIGEHTDGKYYKGGILLTGLVNNRYYENGVPTFGIYDNKYYGSDGYVLDNNLIPYQEFKQNYRNHHKIPSYDYYETISIDGIMVFDGYPVAVIRYYLGADKYYEINFTNNRLNSNKSGGLKWGRLFSEKGTLIQDIYYYEQKGNCPIFLNGKGKALHGIYNVENYGDLEKKEYLGELEPIETKEFDNEQHTLFINGVPLSGEYRGKLYKDGKLCHGTISYVHFELYLPKFYNEIQSFINSLDPKIETNTILFDNGVVVALGYMSEKYYKIDYKNSKINLSCFNSMQSLIGNKVVDKDGRTIRNIFYLSDLDLYLDGIGSVLHGYYQVSDYNQLKNHPDIKFLHPLTIGVFNNAQHTRFSKGKPLTGEYGGKTYKDGKIVTGQDDNGRYYDQGVIINGLHKDGSQYNNGILIEGWYNNMIWYRGVCLGPYLVYQDLLLYQGKPFTGRFWGVQYEKGEKINGIYKDLLGCEMLFKDGRPSAGLYQGREYGDDGYLKNGEYGNCYYQDGKLITDKIIDKSFSGYDSSGRQYKNGMIKHGVYGQEYFKWGIWQNGPYNGRYYFKETPEVNSELIKYNKIYITKTGYIAHKLFAEFEGDWLYFMYGLPAHGDFGSDGTFEDGVQVICTFCEESNLLLDKFREKYTGLYYGLPFVEGRLNIKGIMEQDKMHDEKLSWDFHQLHLMFSSMIYFNSKCDVDLQEELMKYLYSIDNHYYYRSLTLLENPKLPNHSLKSTLTDKINQSASDDYSIFVSSDTGNNDILGVFNIKSSIIKYGEFIWSKWIPIMFSITNSNSDVTQYTFNKGVKKLSRLTTPLAMKMLILYFLSKQENDHCINPYYSLVCEIELNNDQKISSIDFRIIKHTYLSLDLLGPSFRSKCVQFTSYGEYDLEKNLEKRLKKVGADIYFKQKSPLKNIILESYRSKDGNWLKFNEELTKLPNKREQMYYIIARIYFASVDSGASNLEVDIMSTISTEHLGPTVDQLVREVYENIIILASESKNTLCLSGFLAKYDLLKHLKL